MYFEGGIGVWVLLVCLIFLVSFQSKFSLIDVAHFASTCPFKNQKSCLRSPVTTTMALVTEAIGTGVLSFVVFSLTNPKNDSIDDKFIPLVIGLTVGALVSCIAPLTQAGFNPARDFGPRIVAWLAGWRAVAFKKAWVYILAPVVGALGGAFVSDRVLYADDE